MSSSCVAGVGRGPSWGGHCLSSAAEDDNLRQGGKGGRPGGAGGRQDRPDARPRRSQRLDVNMAVLDPAAVALQADEALLPAQAGVGPELFIRALLEAVLVIVQVRLDDPRAVQIDA